MYIFYNNDKVIVGISKVMYREKWYTVLYKSKEIDYLVIKYKNEYIKIDKSDVDDCTYNNITTDSDGNIVLMRGDQLANLIEEGKRVVRENYDVYAIYALVNGYRVYNNYDVVLFFDDNKLIDYVILEDNTLYSDIMKFINNLVALDGDTRRGINKLMIADIDSSLYSAFNSMLMQNKVYKDSDAYRCLSYDFVVAFVNMVIGV